MSTKSKKKRNKKYRMGETETPVVHHYVAETEQRRTTQKRWKRRSILGAILALILLALALALF